MSGQLISCKLKRPDAKLRLICFPGAGGGANQFLAWAKKITPDIEVVGVQLTGRESRYKEPFYGSAQQLARDIAHVIDKQYSDKPFAFFGHSLGALLCQEVAGILKHEYHGKQPRHIYVSGESPPQVTQRRQRKDYSAMPENELRSTLIRMSCLPGFVINSEDLLKIYMPIIKSDLMLVDQIVFDLPKRLLLNPLSCPMVYFLALEDNPFEYEAWSQLTTGDFTVKEFTGAHFYMNDPFNLEKILTIITKDANDL